MIFRNLYRRRDHGRFCGELRMLVTNYNLRRRDLHHRKLRQSSLGRRKGIMISPAAASADNRSRGSEDVCVGRRRDEGYDLALLGLHHDVMPKGRARKNKSYQDNVHNNRAHQAVGPVVVKFAPDFSREWCIGSQS